MGKLFSREKDINFLGIHKTTFTFSAIIIIVSMVLLFTKGLNFGVDFTGGILFELKVEKGIDNTDIRLALKDEGFEDINIQPLEEGNIMIRIAAIKENIDGDKSSNSIAINKIKNILSDKFEGKIEYRKIDFVGPQVGYELILRGILALVMSFVAIMCYIWMRFDWQFGLGAVLALIHDVIISLGLFSLLGLEFNSSSIAAILIIVGYSINDSVVIYDRVRENLRKYKKTDLVQLLNMSINSTLNRTILTAGSTLAALIALVLLGGEVLFGFSLIVLFGIIIGTYSSIYISAPILNYMKIKRMDE